jgi:putative transposase
MQTNYISTNHSKHYLKAHIILVKKYRKPLLVNQLKQDMYTIFNNIIDNSDFSVEVFESDINHIHFLIRYIPRLSISQIVRRLKQQSTKHIWQLHPTLLRREYWLLRLFNR